MLADDYIVKSPAKNQSPQSLPRPYKKIKNKEPNAKKTGQFENQ